MTVIGLVVLVLVPDALFHKGEWALLLVLIGFFLPAVAEFIGHKKVDEAQDCHSTQRRTHKFVLIVSAFAIILHAVTDGAVIALANSEKASVMVAVGIIAHRAGIALTLWWLMAPFLSTRTIYLMLILFALVTYLGFVMAETVYGLADQSLAGYWQAFAAGSLLHVVMHPLRERNIPHAVIVSAQRFGTFIAVFFIVASIYASLELTINPDISLPIQEAAHHGNSHMGMEENLYILQQAGILIAPWMLAFLSIGGLIRSRRHPSVQQFIKEFAAYIPATFVFWLVVSVFYAFLPAHIVHDHVLLLSMDVAGVFYLWMGLVIMTLLVKGAPRFFAALLPDFLSHDHHH